LGSRKYELRGFRGERSGGGDDGFSRSGDLEFTDALGTGSVGKGLWVGDIHKGATLGSVRSAWRGRGNYGLFLGLLFGGDGGRIVGDRLRVGGALDATTKEFFAAF
jgi:hypothetical protein